MLTVMCPNCRLRFPAPGCCNPDSADGILGKSEFAPAPRRSEITRNNAFYGGGYMLMPREYAENNARGCFINAPTIINGPAIIQQPLYLDKIMGERSSTFFEPGTNLTERKFGEIDDNLGFDTTGGSVTITTPRIQSGGCLIRSKDSEILVQSPRIEIRPKHTGCGGYVVQKRLSLDETSSNEENVLDPVTIEPTLPSGCQFLPGIRLSPSRSHNAGVPGSRDDDLNIRNSLETEIRERERSENVVGGGMVGNETRSGDFGRCCCSGSKNSTGSTEDTGKKMVSEGGGGGGSTSGPMEIRVNATVQLPPNVGHCTVNITATTGNPAQETSRVNTAAGRKDNFNGGGIISLDPESSNATSNERREDAPTTPLSWLTPCPWGFDGYPVDKDVTRLTEIKRLLQTSGWYHEGLSWQQSETLLKNAPVGRWLMRDSSDSRFIFAVSVQTNRGPTSVRVHYYLGRFRLDAEPRLIFAMPLFDCPIKMLQYYVDYSNRINERKEEVWIDYSGQLYSQIYLTKPLVKDVQSLSHLARVVVNRNKLSTDNLPPPIKNYLAEYPYSL